MKSNLTLIRLGVLCCYGVLVTTLTYKHLHKICKVFRTKTWIQFPTLKSNILLDLHDLN